MNRYRRAGWRSERGESSELILLIWLGCAITAGAVWWLFPDLAHGWRTALGVVAGLLAVPFVVTFGFYLALNISHSVCLVAIWLLGRCRPSWRARLGTYRGRAEPFSALALLAGRVPAGEFTRVGADSYRAYQHLVHLEQVSGLRLDGLGATGGYWSHGMLRYALEGVPARPVHWWQAPLLDAARPLTSAPFAALALALLAEMIADPGTGHPDYQYRSMRAKEWIAEGLSLRVSDRDIAGWVHASGHLIIEGVIEPDTRLATVLARWDGVRDGWAYALAGLTPDEARTGGASPQEVAVIAALRGHPPLPF